MTDPALKDILEIGILCSFESGNSEIGDVEASCIFPLRIQSGEITIMIQISNAF